MVLRNAYRLLRTAYGRDPEYCETKKSTYLKCACKSVVYILKYSCLLIITITHLLFYFKKRRLGIIMSLLDMFTIWRKDHTYLKSITYLLSTGYVYLNDTIILMLRRI